MEVQTIFQDYSLNHYGILFDLWVTPNGKITFSKT